MVIFFTMSDLNKNVSTLQSDISSLSKRLDIHEAAHRDEIDVVRTELASITRAVSLTDRCEIKISGIPSTQVISNDAAFTKLSAFLELQVSTAHIIQIRDWAPAAAPSSSDMDTSSSVLHRQTERAERLLYNLFLRWCVIVFSLAPLNSKTVQQRRFLVMVMQECL